MYLLPKPQRVEQLTGKYYMPYCVEIKISNGCEKEIVEVAQMLKEEVEKSSGLECCMNRGERTEKTAFYFMQTSFEKKESYKISVHTEGVVLEAGDFRGFLYGVQTLRQIIQQEGAVLPCMEIQDYPYMENRGVYLDATRGRIPTLAFLKKMVDKLSFYKINQLQIYIEHSFQMEGFSEMWRDDTPLTPEDILELDQYCIKRGIELVPSLSLFGHLYKLLKTAEYSHLGEFPEQATDKFSFIGRQEHHTLNVTLEESFELVKEMIEKYIPLFTSNKFNIGADETFDLGKGATKEKAKEIGVNRMYIDFVKKICTFLTEKGKVPMFWGDVICGFPELIKELPKETICLNWGYAWNQTEDSTKALYHAGATQYVCPGTSGWNQFINLMGNAYSNISRMCSYGEKYQAVGVLNTDWGDFGHINHPESSIPGMIYGACFSWNREAMTFEQINKHISKIEYHDNSEKIMEIISDLCQQSSYGWDTAVFFEEIQTKALDWSKEQADKHMKERADLMGQFQEKNDKIEACLHALAECTQVMDRENRKNIYPFLIMAQGMRIFNHIGAFVGNKFFDVPCEITINANELARELECWFYEYKKLWRSVSREAELYRVSHVIFWYSDFLRNLR